MNPFAYETLVLQKQHSLLLQHQCNFSTLRRRSCDVNITNMVAAHLLQGRVWGKGGAQRCTPKLLPELRRGV